MMKLTKTTRRMPNHCQGCCRQGLLRFARISVSNEAAKFSVSNEVVKFSTNGENLGLFLHNVPVDKPDEATITEMEEPVILTITLSSMIPLAAAIPSTRQVKTKMSSNSHLLVVIE
ncbi:hypothetical protein ACFX13_001473 [Malus domestica]|uniref:proliferating cell nuclear antigen-like n=1 Tax=Malus domestica TaxID=3750 RepID=UPI0004987F7D|nr:proliferating cell nuclear antigen-like [Malus domestica]